MSKKLPLITIEAIARSFYKQALSYGFGLDDFVRFANTLLSIALARGRHSATQLDETPKPVFPKYTQLPIVGQKVTLRCFDVQNDRPLLDDWLADSEGRLFLLSTTSGQAQNVDQLISSSVNLISTIVYQGRPIGCVAYLDYDADQRRAELRKLIGDKDLRGQGLAHEASEHWVGYGLGALELRKIYVNTLATNLRNIKLNEELGFRIEGLLRGELLIDGESHDILRMGLCFD
jgi:RimJ/RimL family protein N-acetyltransferase